MKEKDLSPRQNNREEVILDFTKCESTFFVYKEMHEKMEWQDWYGYNLDALWDILCVLPYKGDDFVIIRSKTYFENRYGQNQEFTEDVDKICDMFLEAQEKYGEIKVEIRYNE